MFVVFEQLPDIGSTRIVRKVAVIPRDFSLRPKNPLGMLTPAEHAINVNPGASPYLSGSSKPYGAPSMNGEPLLGALVFGSLGYFGADLIADRISAN
jgi:hypothetical protein